MKSEREIFRKGVKCGGKSFVEKVEICRGGKKGRGHNIFLRRKEYIVQFRKT